MTKIKTQDDQTELDTLASTLREEGRQQGDFVKANWGEKFRACRQPVSEWLTVLESEIASAQAGLADPAMAEQVTERRRRMETETRKDIQVMREVARRVRALGS